MSTITRGELGGSIHKPKTIFARRLRRNQTPHEARLWKLLRNRRLKGYKFYRQFVISGYIVDFCCWSHHVVVELDGSGHAMPEQHAYDMIRDDVLRAAGYRILRVWNSELSTNEDGVLEEILRLLAEE